MSRTSDRVKHARVVPSCIPVRWTILGLAALLASAVGTPAAAVEPATAASRQASPCKLLTQGEVQAVIPGPVRSPMISPAPLLNPPNGTACDRISTIAAHNHRTAIFGVSVQLWDFRAQGPAWTTQWGARAAGFVRRRCLQRAPAGSGITLPITRTVSRVGDYACSVDDTVVELAKGSFLLRVSVGTIAPSKQTRDVVTSLARKAAARLRA
jgi:hypothetical protein